MSSTEKSIGMSVEKGVQEEVFERARATGRALRGLTFSRVYSDPSISPYDAVEWELRTAAITSEKGETIFEQKNVEVPKSWSQTATNIVVQKYFHGRMGTPERETSVRQLIERVAGTITGYGEKGGYFKTAADRDAFHDELAHDPRQPGRLLQFPRLVQRRHRRAPAGLRLLHQLVRRLDGLHPRPRQDRRHALQVRLGHGIEPLVDPWVP